MVVDVTCLVWAFYSFKIIEATKRVIYAKITTPESVRNFFYIFVAQT